MLIGGQSVAKQTEQEFVDLYDGYVARKIARDLYRAMHPVGMHTNGPTWVRVEASHLANLLEGSRRKDSTNDARAEPSSTSNDGEGEHGS